MLMCKGWIYLGQCAIRAGGGWWDGGGGQEENPV